VAATRDDVWLHSACSSCVNSDCPIIVHRVDGVIEKIEGDPDNPHNFGKICSKGHSAIMSMYDPYRVLHPMKRTNPEKGIGVDPKWQQISWEEALTTVAAKLKEVRAKDPRRLFMGSFDHIVMHQTMYPWAQAFGTPNILLVGGSWYCGPALHTALYLTDAQFHSEIDADYCKYAILFGNQMGGNAGSLSTTMGKKMADARLRGMKLVVVDPILTNIAAKADDWLPIRPGTDGALALGMLNVLLNECGIYDAPFLKHQTNAPYLVGPDGLYVRDPDTKKPLVWDVARGRAVPFDGSPQDPALEGSFEVGGVLAHPGFHLFRENIVKYTPESVAEITTIPAESIRRIAKEYGEAALVGAKIVIDGQELPYRPVAVNQNRGANAHKHGTVTALAIQLLSIVVGALYVPGSHMGLNVVGPEKYDWSWEPEADPDGMILTPVSKAFSLYDHSYLYKFEERILEPPYFAGQVKWPPDSPYFKELYPLGLGAAPVLEVVLDQPEKYQPPYVPEMMVLSRCNLMMGRVNPEIMAGILKRIPFIAVFAQQLDESAELADILLPDAHVLERLDFCPQMMHITESPATGHWYFGIRQPVVAPLGEARPWREVLLDLAQRIGMLPELTTLMNYRYELKDPYKLDPEKQYTWEEICDRWGKSLFGPEYGIDWFKANGYLVFKRTPQELYPGPFLKPKWPIYFENFKRAGKTLKPLVEKSGLPVDMSDYEGLLDWRPCPSYEHRHDEYDLYAVNYKLPMHIFSHSPQNAWLNEMGEHHPYGYEIMVHTDAAKRKGIRDGDAIWVESIAGKVQGRAKLTEAIHPECIGIAGNFGCWSEGKPLAKGKGVHWNTLVPLGIEYVDGISSNLDACPRVKIWKAVARG